MKGECQIIEFNYKKVGIILLTLCGFFLIISVIVSQFEPFVALLFAASSIFIVGGFGLLFFFFKHVITIDEENDLLIQDRGISFKMGRDTEKISDINQVKIYKTVTTHRSKSTGTGKTRVANWVCKIIKKNEETLLLYQGSRENTEKLANILSQKMGKELIRE